jgi:hypothetical protein
VSQAALRIRVVGTVTEIETWKLRRASTSTVAVDGPHGSVHREGPQLDRLERATERLSSLVSGLLSTSERVDSGTETELLAIIGELAVGLVDEAATRAERLTERLVAQRAAGRG